MEIPDGSINEDDQMRLFVQASGGEQNRSLLEELY